MGLSSSLTPLGNRRPVIIPAYSTVLYQGGVFIMMGVEGSFFGGGGEVLKLRSLGPYRD